jgi:predicted DNA binding CopG/RHH family protein
MSIPVTRKKRGRPATGQDPTITVRLAPETISAVEGWAERRGISRSEAIRHMIEATIKLGGLGG